MLDVESRLLQRIRQANKRLAACDDRERALLKADIARAAQALVTGRNMEQALHMLEGPAGVEVPRLAAVRRVSEPFASVEQAHDALFAESLRPGYLFGYVEPEQRHTVVFWAAASGAAGQEVALRLRPGTSLMQAQPQEPTLR